VYPKIGENVKMFSDAKVIGDTNIGKNVWISANTYIKDSNIPEQSIVFGSSPNLIIKNRPIEFFLTSAN
jgi:serine O-acetyltransferase